MRNCKLLLVAMIGLLTLGGCGKALQSSNSDYKEGIVKSEFGTTSDGHQAHLYTLTNANGLVAKVSNFGATLVEMHVPNAAGEMADVVLGFDSAAGYASADNPYFGCTVGRVANRIKVGRFTLDGKQYTLATNNEPNHLHGGDKGFSQRLWTAETKMTNDGPSVIFRYTSPDGEEGYPGTLKVSSTYTLTNDNELRIDMKAETDATTLVNLCNHSYWNLAGHTSGSVEGQLLKLNASKYTPTDDTLIPTGAAADVAGTPVDFTSPKPLGQDIAAFKSDDQAHTGGGYDLNYVVDGKETKYRHVATAKDPASGRGMKIYANQPGVQLYTGNWLDNLQAKGGAVYNQHQGFCLETQMIPDAINHPAFTDPILKPGQVYHHVMVHKFEAD